MKLKLMIIIITFRALIAQTEVLIISENVGTEIDEHENRFYRIFPEEKGLIDAQIVRINANKYRILIVKEIRGKVTKVRRYIDQNQFNELKAYVDEQPIFTEKERISMYEGLDFLRVEKILKEIPKPQYVVLKHSGKKELKGTLFEVNNNMLLCLGCFILGLVVGRMFMNFEFMKNAPGRPFNPGTDCPPGICGGPCGECHTDPSYDPKAPHPGQNDGYGCDKPGLKPYYCK